MAPAESPQIAMSSPDKRSILNYVKIARPDHWIKNIFMLPGAALAFLLSGSHPEPHVIGKILLGLVILCITASANYTINEYLDAEFDRFHPLKQNRPGALGLLDRRFVALQYLLLVAVSLGMASLMGRDFLSTSALLLIMGLIYNVPPIRTKDRAYLDVLSESVNNPIRLLMGWFAVVDGMLPPSSVLIAYWMGGAFLMAMKRYSEYRRIANPEIAEAYRRSFKYYTEQSLLLSSLFYANTSSFFLGIFLIKYRIEFLLTFPLIAYLFTWYMRIALERDSAAQAPEKLFRQGRLLGFVAALFLLFLVLATVDIPVLRALTNPVHF
jgi:decaprenyl-phosphate phosphoribosyltransferase